MDVKLTGTEPVTGLDLLAVMFIGLKLTDSIDWAWWWVLAPVWIPLALAAVIISALTIYNR
jgi:hypothetical protein